MPITRTRSVAGTRAVSSSHTVTLPSAPDSGQVGILQIGVDSGSSNRVSGVSQSGATWSLVVQAYNATGTVGLETWICVYGGGAGTSITVNLTSSLPAAAHYVEYAGVDNALPTIATGASVDDTDFEGTGLIQTGYATATAANQRVIGAIAMDYNDSPGATASNSFSLVVENNVATPNTKVFDKTTTSSGSQNSVITPGFSISMTPSYSVGTLVILREGSGGGGFDPKRASAFLAWF